MKQYRYLVSFSSRSGMGSAYVTRTSKLDSKIWMGELHGAQSFRNSPKIEK